MDPPDGYDSSSQQGASSSSNSQEPMDSNSAGLKCMWKNCAEISEDKPAFYYHLLNHAAENMPGPCQWRHCKAAEGAANNRHMRHKPRFMEQHINWHLPKNGFKCMMDGCNKVFDTPEKLTNHISKHPQLKKNEKLDCRLEDPNNGRIREVPCNAMNLAGGKELLQKTLKVHEILRSIGITHVPFSGDYFITVHGHPEGDVILKPAGREQNYRLRFPYSPTWMKEMYIRCILDPAESRDTVITWKLPLANPVFRDQLRIFVKKVEVEFAQQPV